MLARAENPAEEMVGIKAGISLHVSLVYPFKINSL